MGTITASAADVQRLVGQFKPRHGRTHGRGASHDGVSRNGQSLQPHQESAGLGWFGLTGQNRGESSIQFGWLRLLASGEDGKGSGHAVHADTPAGIALRKLAIIAWPCSVTMLSGWNCTP